MLFQSIFTSKRIAAGVGLHFHPILGHLFEFGSRRNVVLGTGYGRKGGHAAGRPEGRSAFVGILGGVFFAAADAKLRFALIAASEPQRAKPVTRRAGAKRRRRAAP